MIRIYPASSSTRLTSFQDVPDDGDGIVPCARCSYAGSTDVASVARLPKLGLIYILPARNARNIVEIEGN
jgi:hypothetical protein